MNLSESAPSFLSRPNPRLKPDLNNPDSYYAPCGFHFASRQVFRYHLRTIHNIKLNSIPQSQPQQSKRQYQEKISKFGFHKDGNVLQKQRRHQQEKQLLCGGAVFDNYDDFSDEYCYKCNIAFASEYNYRRHINNKHSKAFGDGTNFTTSTATKSAMTSAKQVLPDIDNPDYYCKVCKLHKSNKKSYHYQLELKYQMDLITQQTTTVTPEKVYNNTTTFMMALPLKTKKAIPDKDDLDNYCCACKDYYLNKEIFYHHLEFDYGMVLNAPPTPPFTLSPPPPQLYKINKKNDSILSRLQLNRKQEQQQWKEQEQRLEKQ